MSSNSRTTAQDEGESGEREIMMSVSEGGNKRRSRALSLEEVDPKQRQKKTTNPTITRRFSNPEEKGASQKLADLKQLTRSLSSVSPGSRSNEEDEESLEEELMELHKQVNSEVNILKHLEEDFRKDIARMNQGLDVEDATSITKQNPKLSNSTLHLLQSETIDSPPRERDLLSVENNTNDEDEEDDALPDGSQEFVQQLQTMLNEAESRLDQELQFPQEKPRLQTQRTTSNASSTGSRTPTKISHLIDMFDLGWRRSSSQNSGDTTSNANRQPTDATGYVKETAEAITNKVQALNDAKYKTPSRTSSSTSNQKSPRFTKTPPTVTSPDSSSLPQPTPKNKQKTLALDDYFNANHQLQYKQKVDENTVQDCNTTVSSITTHTSASIMPKKTVQSNTSTTSEQCDTTTESVTSTTQAILNTQPQSTTIMPNPNEPSSPPSTNPENTKYNFIRVPTPPSLPLSPPSNSITQSSFSTWFTNPQKLKNLFYRHQSWLLPVFGMCMANIWSPNNPPATFSAMPRMNARGVTLFSFSI